MSEEKSKWDSYIEESFGYTYDDLTSMAKYFGISKMEAIGIFIVVQLQKLNENSGNVDFSLREIIRK